MKKRVLIFTSALLLLGACSNNEEQKKSVPKVTQEASAIKTDKEQTKTKKNSSIMQMEKTKTVPQLPKTTKDIINQYAGPYAGRDLYDTDEQNILEKKVSKLKPISENASKKELDQLYSYLYALTAEDFPDPLMLTEKWKYYSYGNPDVPDSKYQFKENYNIEIILDSSGSMAQKINGTSKMELAKKSIDNFLASVPKEANISLRVYGHVGTNAGSDKFKSCKSSELIYGLKKYDESSFSNALNQFKPSGWTPIADSLKKAKEDLSKYDGKSNTNLVYLVSDGIETCDGNPIQAAKELSQSNISPILNVIGFDVDAEGQKQMRAVADAAGGIYTTVNNQKELEDEFNKTKEILQRWEDWKSNALSDADAQETDRDFEILDFSNNWNDKELTQSNNLYAVMQELHLQDRITTEQYYYLQDKHTEMKKFIRQSLKEVKADLYNLNAQTLKQTKKAIEEKYKNNVQ